MSSRFYDNTSDRPPKFWPGDRVRDIEDPEEIGVVEFSRRDGMVCIRWPSQRKEWLSQENLQWAPGFAPSGRC